MKIQRKLFAALLIVIIFQLKLIAHQYTDYFPITIGNSWTYYESGIENLKHTTKIIDTLNVNGNLYYYFGNNKEASILIRPDSSGRIWKLQSSEESLWFDFKLTEADSYFCKTANPNINYIVKVNRDLRIETKFGIYNNCILFIFDDPNAVDEEHYYTFAPNLGLIKESTGMGITWLLDSAIIKGEIITGVIQDYKRKDNKINS